MRVLMEATTRPSLGESILKQILSRINCTGSTSTKEPPQKIRLGVYLEASANNEVFRLVEV